ncbi:MAG: hypothetical protein AAGA87_16850 [Pseudomonadota bacterium]
MVLFAVAVVVSGLLAVRGHGPAHVLLGYVTTVFLGGVVLFVTGMLGFDITGLSSGSAYTDPYYAVAQGREFLKVAIPLGIVVAGLVFSRPPKTGSLVAVWVLILAVTAQQGMRYFLQRAGIFDVAYERANTVMAGAVAVAVGLLVVLMLIGGVRQFRARP